MLYIGCVYYRIYKAYWIYRVKKGYIGLRSYRVIGIYIRYKGYREGIYRVYSIYRVYILVFHLTMIHFSFSIGHFSIFHVCMCNMTNAK